jgi:hypothetical protein
VPASFSTDGKEQYRLYFLNDLGHITKSHEFFATDDTDAVRISEGWREGRSMELWTHDRKVRAWSSQTPGVYSGGKVKITYPHSEPK